MRKGTGRRAAASAALLCAAVALLLASGAPVSAAGGRSFDAVANGNGLRTLLSSPGAPLTDTIVDAGGPSAQARLSSIGISTAFAAYPDPGGTVLGAPSTAGTSAVSYPVAVFSSYPVTPSQKVEQGPYVLSAASQESGSQAAARSGQSDTTGDAALVSSTATVSQQGEAVTALATSDDRSLGVGPLSLGRVLATAKVTRSGDGAPERSSSFSAEGLSAAGTAFGLGPGGLTIAGTTTPLPDASPVTSVLSGAGITITYLVPEQTPTGIVSAGMQVEVVSPGGQRTVYVLGQAAARISQTVDPAAGGGTVLPPITSGPVPTTGGTTPVGPGTVAPPPGLSGPTQGPVTQPTVAPTPETGQPQAQPVVRRAAVDGWPRSYFLVLVAGGVLAVLAASLLSTLGVRYP